MTDRPHLSLAGAPPDRQLAALLDIVRASVPLMAALRMARGLNLPDGWIVSGAIYNTVWNHLTGRPALHGIKDIDLFYWDPDTSWEAEDRVIRRLAALWPGPPPVEARNQARVPLWYQDHYGHPYPAITSSRQAIDLFACKTHCVGLRLRADDGFDVHTPFGLDDIFAFRLTPNPALPNRATHEAKAVRQLALWPELTVVPWPD
jgi:uncharacterized protein